MSTDADGGLSAAAADMSRCNDAWLLPENEGRERSTNTTAAAAAAAAAVACDAGCSSREGGAKSTEDDQARYMNLRHKYNRRTIQGHCRPKREAARSMCRPLKQWLYSHRDQPYPTKADKLQLASQSQMTVVQVSNWFANARRRLKKTVSCSAGLSWERRFKLYNRSIAGNQERLSISSDESDSEGEKRLEDFTSDDGGESFEAVSAASTKPCSASSGNFSGEEKDFLSPLGDQCSNLPGKFKQGILHRYLTDACNMSFANSDINDLSRIRKLSGSPESRDSAASMSCRSTPFKEQQTEENLEKSAVYLNGFAQGNGGSDECDLQLLELSAVHILASLAASGRNSLRTSKDSQRL